MSTRLTQEDIIPAKSDVGALANRINAETKSAHDKINGLIDIKMAFVIREPRVYRQGIQAFYHVFRTFEECWHEEMKADTRIGHILDTVWSDVLARSEPISKDLMYFYQDSSKFATPKQPAQIEFVEHIKQITKEKPHVLLAYAHVLYMALFAGGRIIRATLERSGLFPKEPGVSKADVARRGTNMFIFDVEDPMAFRAQWKRTYELETRNALTEQEKQDIIDESSEIFLRSHKMLAELVRVNSQALKNNIKNLLIHILKYILIILFVIYALYKVYYTAF
ncbi:hypothetical protein CANCADRAFT_23332 [Tortispora caseinolytica NRRL Y-17796]|uniref:Heme oxygenase n=1 Tax=Tortispora caseinolytica NRRL Y-17796 TaxID=767744 RepID=A0A1E4TJ39_9ASCO|nr:hypothetical protein CANCADRAFT_23332 [Tortispora caseinolytica NRRL Y-17796]